MPMKKYLIIIFGAILVAMLWITVTASLQENVFTAGARLWPDPWFQATLADAYFGFITFLVWALYKEKSYLARILWVVLVLAFGNIAMSVYVLLKVFQLKKDESWSELLLRRD